MGFVQLGLRRGLVLGYMRGISSEVALLREGRGPEAREARVMEAKAVQDMPVEAPKVEEKPPGREDWFRVLPKELFEGVTVVRHGESAAKALKVLTSLQNRPHAWDTETTGVDPKKESPVGKGRVICATAFAGDDVDFGSGPRLFIDNLDAANGTLDCFKNYFANERLVKVWHNYSFDKHVLHNEGISVRGFGGDTMHMARLADTARRSYSLKALCETYLDGEDYGKQDLVTRFGYKRILKDGSEGKDTVVPDTVDLQRSVEHAAEWVDYATRDAELTYHLYWALRRTLEDIKTAEPSERNDLGIQNMSELYSLFFLAYGELLADMEQLGVRVDVSRLKRAQALAEADRELLEAKFRDWVCMFSPEAKYMNVNSDKQKQHILFAPFVNKKTGIKHDREVSFKLEEPIMVKKQVVDEESGKVVEKEVLKKEAVLVGRGLECPSRTVGGVPSVAASALKLLAGKPRGDPPVYGLAEDPEACLAIDSIMEASAVSTLLSSFIVPLQDYPDATGRIHASLNLNTETGRLSSRRPNLQNQPALEKDRYKIRDAFVAAPGNSLIVADYGQLELRLLAHITGCKSMLDAFRLGGDFHSRTAATMYSEVQKAVQEGACVLEGDGSGDVPLVKDLFPTERRRAKTLNFSIAYGKTVMGLAKDWDISRKEAKETLALWYKEREEVRSWQRRCLKKAREKEFVETIIGRRRNLPDIRSSDPRRRYHAERAAINAPLQGSAADVVMAAMLSLDKDDCLRALGWRIVLQVHDEIILEGPEWSAELAKERIRKVMENPEGIYLTVALDVSPKTASSWYKAK